MSGNAMDANAMLTLQSTVKALDHRVTKLESSSVPRTTSHVKIPSIIHLSADGNRSWSADMSQCVDIMSQSKNRDMHAPSKFTLKWSSSSNNWVCISVD